MGRSGYDTTGQVKGAERDKLVAEAASARQEAQGPSQAGKPSTTPTTDKSSTTDKGNGKMKSEPVSKVKCEEVGSLDK